MNSKELDTVVKEIMRVPYSKHKAKAVIKALIADEYGEMQKEINELKEVIDDMHYQESMNNV